MILAAVLLTAALAVAGCREEKPQVPNACLDGPRAIRTALAKAPGDVSLDGTKLSECLVKSSETGDLQAFGGNVLDTITVLAARAKAKPESPAALQLGYLHGALTRGADTGIHDELIRRVDQELLGVKQEAGAYRRGEAAGREGG